MRQRRMKTEELRQLVRAGQRCPARHPNWHGSRCEKSATDHIIHHAEQRNLEWIDRRTA